MPWTPINNTQTAGWLSFNTAQPGNWGAINNGVPLSRAGVSGVGVSEVAVSGATDTPPDWTPILTE